MRMEQINLWPGREDVTLTGYITPKDPFWPFPTTPRPAMIVCPGGAYLNLSDSESDPMAMDFAVHGYQAFVLRYSVGTVVSRPEQARYPAQLRDLARAIAVVRENSGRWNLDPDKVAIMGFSAGGHLCASYAVHWHELWLAEEMGVDSAVLRPSAAVLGYPITDYVLQDAAFEHPIPMMVASNQTLFGVARPGREELERLSPCLHVTEHTPPVFLAHAADDQLVPVGNSYQMAQALDRAGIPYEFHVFRQGSHGFADGRDMDKPWENGRVRGCAAWLPLVRTWLQGALYPQLLEPEPPSVEDFMRLSQEQHQQ